MLFASVMMAQVNKAKVDVHFAPASVVIDSQTADNSEQLNTLGHLISEFSQVPVSDRYLTIYSYVSPDEDVTNAGLLAEERAKAAHRTFDEKLRSVSQCDAHAIYKEKVNSWNDVLSAIRRDVSVPFRDEVIQTMEGQMSYGQITNDMMISALKLIGDGSAYQYIADHILADMRRAEIVLRYLNMPERPKQETVQENIETTQELIESGSVSLQQEPSVNSESAIDEQLLQRETTGSLKWPNLSSRLALKTNILYDVFLLPNIAVEWSFAKDLSVSADWMYAWCSKDSKHRYWRAYGGNLQFNYWLGHKKRQFTGHHIGVYGGMITYDVEFGAKGYQGAKWNYMAGVAYGYSIPAGKRININFELGIGYLGGDYYEYDYNDSAERYFWQQTKKRKWVGPTKAEISLVWLLGK